MIVVVIDDEMRYKVMHHGADGAVTEVTEHWQVNPLIVEVEGKQIHGFHIGQEQQ